MRACGAWDWHGWPINLGRFDWCFAVTLIQPAEIVENDDSGGHQILETFASALDLVRAAGLTDQAAKGGSRYGDLIVFEPVNVAFCYRPWVLGLDWIVAAGFSHQRFFSRSILQERRNAIDPN